MLKAFLPAVHPALPQQEWAALPLWLVDEHPDREKILTESEQVKSTIRSLVEASKQLKSTPLVDNTLPVESIDSTHINLLKKAVQAGVPQTAKNEGLYSHLHLASAFAGELAKAADKKSNAVLHSKALEAAGFLNDLGKLTGIFRYHFNDLVGEEILNGMGIRQEILKCFQPAKFNVGPVHMADAKTMGSDQLTMRVNAHVHKVKSTLTPEQELFILADVAGKMSKKNPKEIQTWEEMETYHLQSRKSPEAYEALIGEKAIWPSEVYAYSRISGWADGWLSIYRDLKKKWKARGADVDEIRITLQNQ